MASGVMTRRQEIDWRRQRGGGDEVMEVAVVARSQRHPGGLKVGKTSATFDQG